MSCWQIVLFLHACTDLLLGFSCFPMSYPSLNSLLWFSALVLLYAGSAAQKPCVQDLTDESGGEPRSEALIFLEFEIIKTPSSPQGTTATKDQANTTEMHILNLQFNSLDFIG